MQGNKRNILSVIALVIVGALLVGGALLINSRINQRESVAPTAPESKPAASSCTLEFTVAGPTPSPTPPGVCIDTYADVMIIIDRSDSMNDMESGKKKIDWVKESANNLIDAYGTGSSGRIRFGVVVFGMKGTASSSTDIYAARTLSAPTNNYAQLKTTINGITGTDSGTCIECGIRLANTELEKSANGISRVAILLSDGDATYTWDRVQSRPQARTAAYNAATAGRAKAIRYITARYGNSTDGETVMKTIAGSTGFYAYHPATKDWSSALTGLGEQICKPAPTPSPTPTPTPTPTPVPACGTSCTATSQCLSGMSCISGLCRNPSCSSSTTCLCPTPTPTPSPTPTPTPTPSPSPTPSPTPVLSCGSTCVLDGDCPASMVCSTGVCRNPSCTDSASCLCPTPTPTPTPSPTPVPYCGSTCTANDQCPSNMVCSSGVCRNPSCTDASDCLCPTPTPTPSPTPPPYVAYCSQTCAQNGDCYAPLVCDNGQCRNPSCTGESSCMCPTNPPVYIAQSTPEPTIEPLPQAGSTVPTMVVISVGLLMILISIFAFVTI